MKQVAVSLPRQKRIERTERWRDLAGSSDTIDSICLAVADGRGLIPWCRERDVRYLDVVHWLEADPSRAIAYDIATKARGTATVAQLESVTRQAMHGTVDPRAAAVASKNLQWLAGVYDRKRYGEQMRVDHKHGFSADHLATLKALAQGVSVQRVEQDAPRVSASGFQHAPQFAHVRDMREEAAPVIDGQFRSVPDPERQGAAPSAQVLDEAELFGI
jgi:hypothetical protein